MKNMSLANIAKACNGSYCGKEEQKQCKVTGVTIDSREATEGCLFVAIKGERVDGHKFIPDVFAKGALCVISEQEIPDCEGPYIRVESSLQAVKDIAEFYRQQLRLIVVGVTGSVGKTSTKEVIASVLAVKHRVLKTLGNFNNELGLPLTIFRLTEEDEIAVLEMGISDFGEMRRLSKIARPDICVITNIGECHLDNLKDRDGVLKAKTEMFEYMVEDGVVILNGDDDKLRQVMEVQEYPPVFFGVESACDVYATDVTPQGLNGIGCILRDGYTCIPVLIPIPGYHMVLNALAATAVGLTLGMTLTEIKEGIKKLEPLGGRFHIIETEQMTIIDDCYNANPVSMKASLDILKDAQHRKVAILGDMFELGENAAYLHSTIGEKAAENKIDLLICVGEMSKHLADAAIKAGGCERVIEIATLEELNQQLPDLVKAQDTILVKASHGMHFEKVVAALENIVI